jgi:hypothetical protein
MFGTFVVFCLGFTAAWNVLLRGGETVVIQCFVSCTARNLKERRMRHVGVRQWKLDLVQTILTAPGDKTVNRGDLTEFSYEQEAPLPTLLETVEF